MKNKIEIKKKSGHFKVWEDQARNLGKLGREISFKTRCSQIENRPLLSTV